MAKAKNLTGQKFNRLTVVERMPNAGTHARWKCRCDCGNETVVEGTKLTRGETKSCGCLGRENARKASRKHGGYGTRLYRIWIGMKERCNNPEGKDYRHYGDRGITVCPEWSNDFQAFYDWSMANGYRDDLTIDRIDSKGNYEPSNCKWATPKEQANNRRSNRQILFVGESHTISEWGEITGLGRKNIGDRLRAGWTIEDALTIPKIEKKGVSHDRLQHTNQAVRAD